MTTILDLSQQYVDTANNMDECVNRLVTLQSAPVDILLEQICLFNELAQTHTSQLAALNERVRDVNRPPPLCDALIILDRIRYAHGTTKTALQKARSFGQLLSATDAEQSHLDVSTQVNINRDSA